MKEQANQLIKMWEYWYQIIRDTTDVNGAGFRLNPAGAGDLQSLIHATMEMLEMWIQEEVEKEQDNGESETVQTE